MRHRLGFAIAAGALAAASAPAATPPSALDSFRIGDAGVVCSASARTVDPAMKGMFDRAYAILCRDATSAVGKLYALRQADDVEARLAAIRGDGTNCAPAMTRTVDGLGEAQTFDCTSRSDKIPTRTYVVRRGRTVYAVEGLAGYDSALQLALRTIVEDRLVPGEISAATTTVADPAAFARVQAGTLDPEQALAEGYRRNNSGSYAEAAEFFDTLLQRGNVSRPQMGEYLINRALQKSNLGEFAEADALFAQAALLRTSDPVQLRLRRNFRAIHLINERLLPEALAELSKPITPVRERVTPGGAIDIDSDMAAEINSAVPLTRPLGVGSGVALTPTEKSAILDAQALELRGSILRQQSDLAGAEAALTQALAALEGGRGPRVTSTSRLRAQTMGELSLVAESRGDLARAESLLRGGVALIEREYPNSVALNASKARLAAYLSRHGKTQPALDLYREVVAGIVGGGSATAGYENLLAPYLALLAREIPNQPTLVDDFFLASETLVRPGVAETQALLARELSGGSDEAARLFRQSLSLTREVERLRVEAARLAALAEPAALDTAKLAQIREQLAALEAEQSATQAQLAAFPRFRAVSTKALTLTELRATLKPGEAYLKLATIGGSVYGMLATAEGATAYRAALTPDMLQARVAAIRSSIAVVENGELQTYPFDVKLARQLYLNLLGPVEARMAGISHLVFEPAGAMLQLPINLLITEQAGVDAYLKRTADPKADEFDFRGIAWLGRKASVSTSVSARAFRDVRGAARSTAPREYLGLGKNAPVTGGMIQVAATRSARAAGAIDCSWPLEVWNKPIADTELRTASGIVGNRGAALITGPAFTDAAVRERADLGQYRILHFATHGLVTAPRPECPARPALLTSFAPTGSDGLLSFAEIFDLRLDADLVILSACDTAGQASVAATREVGVTSGGGTALDGLVRAFIGAGGRSVLASHWPAPDSFNATERLITSLFDAPAGTSVADALRAGEIRLMDQADTSHPYYWAGFSIIGDGTQSVLRAPAQTAALQN